MNYEQRDALNKSAIAVLDEAVAAGERLGYWTVEREPERTADEHFPSRWRYVRDAEGLRFSLGAGSWQREGKIAAQVAAVTEDGMTCHLSDVIRSGLGAPDAAADHKRGAEAVAKDLYRRVVNNEDAKAAARAIKNALAQRLESRRNLHAHIHALAPLGFTATRDFASDAYYSANLYRAGFGGVRLYSNGRVELERMTVDAEKLPALLALLGTPQ